MTTRVLITNLGPDTIIVSGVAAVDGKITSTDETCGYERFPVGPGNFREFNVYGGKGLTIEEVPQNTVTAVQQARCV